MTSTVEIHQRIEPLVGEWERLARRSIASPPPARIVAAGLAGGAAWAGAAAFARPDAAASFALAHPTFLPGASAIALTAVALAAGLARATRV